jgi:hypothetical protein
MVNRSPIVDNRWRLRAGVPPRHAQGLSVRARRIGGVLKFLRSRRPRAASLPAPEAVDAFWRRWAALRPRVAAALDAGHTDVVEPMVAAAVGVLDPRLGWSLGTGERSRYALMVTGEGDRALRAITDAWLAAAPPPDADWEYHDAALAHDDPSEVTLALGDLYVPLSEIRVAAQPAGELVNVAVFHPAMAGLRGADRDALTFVPLDVALGERLVERRIGRVEPVDAEPPNALDLHGLRALVVSLHPAEQPVRV